jgi:hypothetical protein
LANRGVFEMSNPVQSTEAAIEERLRDLHDDLLGPEFETSAFLKAADEIASLKKRIAELEANERAYEEIIGPMTYREVADRIRELERTIALAAEYLQKQAERRTIMLGQSSWMPKRSTVEADRNAFVSVENTLRAALQPRATTP